MHPSDRRLQTSRLPYPLRQGRSHVSKIGCPSFFPVPTNVQLQRSKALKGEEWGRVSPPIRVRGLGERRKLPSGVRGGAPAANDFGAFHVQFYAISSIISAFNSCLKWEIPTFLQWLVGLISPFNFFGVSDTPNLNFWGVRTATTPTVAAPLR